MHAETTPAHPLLPAIEGFVKRPECADNGQWPHMAEALLLPWDSQPLFDNPDLEPVMLVPRRLWEQLVEKSTPDALTPDLNQQLFRSATTAAINGVYHLGLLGCCIRRIEIAGATPVIEIDPPPPGPFLRGALHRRVNINGVISTTMVARTHGCTVQWESIAQTAPLAQAGA